MDGVECEGQVWIVLNLAGSQAKPPAKRKVGVQRFALINSEFFSSASKCPFKSANFKSNPFRTTVRLWHPLPVV